MGRFQGLSGIKTNQGGLFFEPGNYTVDIDEVKFINNRKKVDCFIVAAKVIESDNPSRAPGCKPSQVITIREDILETCMGNIKAFAGAILGIPDPDGYVAEVDPKIAGDTPEAATDRFWDEALEALVSEAQPAKGIRIKLNVTAIEKRDQSKGKYFNRHSWGPIVNVPENKAA
jgi:hypothetical protein